MQFFVRGRIDTEIPLDDPGSFILYTTWQVGDGDVDDIIDGYWDLLKDLDTDRILFLVAEGEFEILFNDRIRAQESLLGKFIFFDSFDQYFRIASQGYFQGITQVEWIKDVLPI